MADPAKIYIDSCCFIHAVQHRYLGTNREDKDSWALEQLLYAAMDLTSIELYITPLTIAECRGKVRRADGTPEFPEEVRDNLRNLFRAGRPIRIIGITPRIGWAAVELFWDHGITGLKGPDALHIAAACHVGCTEFLTMDRAIVKRAADLDKLGLEVRLPRNTAHLPSAYRSDDMFANTESQQPAADEAASAEARDEDPPPPEPTP